jgi:class 3 adenylate cyclase
MKRRSKSGGVAIKGRRRKTPEPKRRNAPKAVARSASPAAEGETEVARLTRELNEARQQQMAATDVLEAISSFAGELDVVFRTILTNATRICQAKFGVLMLREGDGFRAVAIEGAPAAYTTAMAQSQYIPPRTGSGLVVLAQTKRPVQMPDLQVEPGYVGNRLTTLAGARTLLIGPMLRKDELIGAINIYRQEVRPFAEKQIELLMNFAAQAVIAIENARLLNELRQSLEQQTATSQVLQVVSSSPGNLEPVFHAMLENATRLCSAKYGVLYRYDGQHFSLAKHIGAGSKLVELMKRGPISPHPDTILGRILVSKSVVQIEDARKERAYLERHPVFVAGVEQDGALSLLGVPMLKDGALVGAFVIFRQEVRIFTDKQIELVKNFAAQAVIAIENARLLKELRERTKEVEKLNQHLEQRVTDQVDEIERMGRLRRFLPPQVADLIVASGSEKQLESHRREITALFCDLRGFTGFSESADPEDVMTLLREYHEALGASIIKYSGTLERYAGDGVMVVFNDPVPVENPALQAVLMALEMRDAIGALTETWRRWGHDIGFGIGIAHGFATLGTIGFEGRFDYAAIGTVSNVASRLCDEAKPGQILISPRVLTKVESAVKVEPVAEFVLKGIRRPLAAYNVVATNPAN